MEAVSCDRYASKCSYVITDGVTYSVLPSPAVFHMYQEYLHEANIDGALQP